jgi:hypothetical protein
LPFEASNGHWEKKRRLGRQVEELQKLIGEQAVGDPFFKKRLLKRQSWWAKVESARMLVAEG